MQNRKENIRKKVIEVNKLGNKPAVFTVRYKLNANQRQDNLLYSKQT